MILDPNPLYYWMLTKWANRDKRDKLILCNEGGSRSSKTFEAIRFIATYCDHNRNENRDIYLFRDTLTNCRDFTVKDFKRCLGRDGMGIFEERNMVYSPKPTYKLFNQVINFRGLDEDAEANRSDLIFFNELLECNKEAFDSWKMRNESIIIADWNPRYSDHWAFDLEKLPNCSFSHTTYKNNKFLPESLIREIESYSPWLIEDMHLPEKKRRPHKANIKSGTANKYRWNVYGLGLRDNQQGLVFPEANWIDKFPSKRITLNGQSVRVDDVDDIGYGLDFGKTAQTAIVKIGIRWTKPKPDLYIQKLFYHPTENSDIVIEILKGLKLKKHIWADNNMPGWIADIRRAGIDIFPTVKFDGSREYWITSIKKFNIHIVKDPDMRKEQENFCYRVVDGKQLSETIKKYDHLWSATGYGVVGDFAVKEEE